MAKALGLDAEVQDLWATSLRSVLVFSFLGGLAGLFSRLQRDQRPAGFLPVLYLVVYELSCSLFVGLLLFFACAHLEVSTYTTIGVVLIGSWLGSRATTLLWAWVKDNKNHLLGLVGGGLKK